jgi:hypothetical protein
VKGGRVHKGGRDLKEEVAPGMLLMFMFVSGERKGLAKDRILTKESNSD